MAKASGVSFEIDSSSISLLPEVLELIEAGMLTRGDKNNRSYVGNTVRFSTQVSSTMQSALFDPQTAGGLLISLDAENADEYVGKVSDAVVVGAVRKNKSFFIEVN